MITKLTSAASSILLAFKSMPDIHNKCPDVCKAVTEVKHHRYKICNPCDHKYC